jgi:ferredoxin-NADP reductase
MKLSDFKGVFKKTILTIESIENPYGDYFSIKLKPTSEMSWHPGEHGIFTLPNIKVEGKKWRGFSIASIEKEGFVLLGTRTGKEISSFKQALLGMKKGERVSIRGPFGWFKLQDESSPMVLFASGVGVTPIRGLLKELEDSNKRDVEIIYASSSYYLYGEEIGKIADKNLKIVLHKITSAEESVKKIEELAKKYGNRAYYYNSGKPKVLKAVKKQLKALNIRGNRIIDDSFLGY